MPTGCLSEEPYSYITCHCTDESWTEEQSLIHKSFSDLLKNDIQISDIIVCSTNAPHKGSMDSIFRLFHIAKVINILEENKYTVSILSNALNLYTFKMLPGFGGIINLNMIRIKASEVYRTDDLTVVLDNLYVEQIIKCSFNGINF